MEMHAQHFREYNVRVNGRDWYDFVWYVAKQVRLNLTHLEERMRQSKSWNQTDSLTKDKFLELLKNKIEHVNIASAKDDIRNFIKDSRSIEIWSKEFFISLLPKIIFA